MKQKFTSLANAQRPSCLRGPAFVLAMASLAFAMPVGAQGSDEFHQPRRLEGGHVLTRPGNDGRGLGLAAARDEERRR